MKELMVEALEQLRHLSFLLYTQIDKGQALSFNRMNTG